MILPYLHQQAWEPYYNCIIWDLLLQNQFTIAAGLCNAYVMLSNSKTFAKYWLVASRGASPIYQFQTFLGTRQYTGMINPSLFYFQLL